MKQRHKIRTVGWLAVAGMLVAAMLTPAAAIAGSTNAVTEGANTSTVVEQCGVVPLDVVLLIDRSTSMGSESRLVIAKTSANSLVSSLDANGGVGGTGIHHVGLTSFAGDSGVVNVALGSASAATVTSAINGLHASGNTHTKHGMAKAAADMLAGDRAAATQVMIFLSDGEPNPSSESPSTSEKNAFKAAADQVFTIALGVSGSGVGGVDPAFMASIAKPNDASHAYWAKTAGDLPNIFSLIYEEIACVTEPPVTEPPVTEPPVTEPPVTEPPVTEPPVTEPPVTEPPVTPSRP